MKILGPLIVALVVPVLLFGCGGGSGVSSTESAMPSGTPTSPASKESSATSAGARVSEQAGPGEAHADHTQRSSSSQHQPEAGSPAERRDKSPSEVQAVVDQILKDVESDERGDAPPASVVRRLQKQLEDDKISRGEAAGLVAKILEQAERQNP
jgi:hypothetical protein